eukprot:c30758_g1_i1 orf=333-497(+)
MGINKKRLREAENHSGHFRFRCKVLLPNWESRRQSSFQKEQITSLKVWVSIRRD